MKQGRINQTLNLLRDDNSEHMTKISKDDFNTDKTTGCKPSDRWADKRELTLNVALTTEINKIRTNSTHTDNIQRTEIHRSESDTFKSPNGSSEQDLEITALNNTNIKNTNNRNGYQHDYYAQYKLLYNNDNNSSNKYKKYYQTYDKGKYMNGTQTPDVSNTPYYRNRSNSPHEYRNSYNYRNNQNYDVKKPYSQDNQRYDNITNGYKRQSEKQY